jgi:hypothetical protein
VAFLCYVHRKIQDRFSWSVLTFGDFSCLLPVFEFALFLYFLFSSSLKNTHFSITT